MPSPLGHGLAGAIVGLSAEQLVHRFRLRRRVPPALISICVALAVLPDADLLYLPIHRTITHSFTAAVAVIIIAAGVTRWVTGSIDWAVAVACGLASTSHILLDWLGQDFNYPRGVQMFWPFSERWVISGWDVFRGTERDNLFTPAILRHNAITGLQELLLLGPLALALWFARKRATRAGRAGAAGRNRQA